MELVKASGDADQLPDTSSDRFNPFYRQRFIKFLFPGRQKYRSSVLTFVWNRELKILDVFRNQLMIPHLQIKDEACFLLSIELYNMQTVGLNTYILCMKQTGSNPSPFALEGNLSSQPLESLSNITQGWIHRSKYHNRYAKVVLVLVYRKKNHPKKSIA